MSSERLFHPTLDAELREDYPDALQMRRDTCVDFVQCIPTNACKGNNTAPQDINIRKACKKYEERDDVKPTVCKHDLQCQVRSFGKGCSAALSSVCDCPPDWSVGVSPRTCMKRCLSEKQKVALLTDAGCPSVEALRLKLDGTPCDMNKPEDCSRCTPIQNSSFAEAPSSGHCECDEGHTRCSLCTAFEFYRMNGECEPCPDNPELILAACVLAVFTAAIAAYILDKKDFNMAFISIGVDYFQVLAIFGNADVAWPQILMQLFRILSLFNLNIDVAAPECLVPDMDYRYKFYGTLLLPIAVFLVTFVGFVFSSFYENVCMRRKDRNQDILSTLVSTILLFVYYMYLALTGGPQMYGIVQHQKCQMAGSTQNFQASPAMEDYADVGTRDISRFQ